MSSTLRPFQVLSHSSGPTNGRRTIVRAPVTSGPLFLLLVSPPSDRVEVVKGAPAFGAACVPFTTFTRSVKSKSRERGPGVSGGSPPWRSLRQSLIGAPFLRARVGPHQRLVQYPIRFPSGLHDPPHRSAWCSRLPVARPASIRILAAFLGTACKIRSFE